MGTYWAMSAMFGVCGFYYLLAAFIQFPEWLAPRRFPGFFGLVTAVLPDRAGAIVRRLLMTALFWGVGGWLAFQTFKTMK